MHIMQCLCTCWYACATHARASQCIPTVLPPPLPQLVYSRRTCPMHRPRCLQIMLPVFGTEEEPSPSALYENDDVVTINVFDEIINDRVGEPRVPTTNKWVRGWLSR
jgi:hypothetical protein